MLEKNYNQEEFRKMIEELSEFSSATVHEALGRIGSVDYEIKPISTGMKICGPAVTAKCHLGDNIMLHKAIAIANPGDVIVANMGNCKQSGAWGEITSLASKVKGINGFVTDGGVRDTKEISEMKFPVFSKSVCIQGTVKSTIGTINEAISFGGVVVNPGDVVLGDDDGIVIIPRNLIKEAIEKSAQREEKERIMKEKIKQGASTVNLLGLTEMLDMQDMIK